MLLGRNFLRTSARRAGRLSVVVPTWHKHQLRHAHAIEMAHERIPLPIIQRQLGNMPISGSRRSISKGSTTRRSSTPCTPDDRRRSRPPSVCTPLRSPRPRTETLFGNRDRQRRPAPARPRPSASPGRFEPLLTAPRIQLRTAARCLAQPLGPPRRRAGADPRPVRRTRRRRFPGRLDRARTRPRTSLTGRSVIATCATGRVAVNEVLFCAAEQTCNGAVVRHQPGRLAVATLPWSS